MSLDPKIFKGFQGDIPKIFLPELLQSWAVQFKDESLLAQALTHSSYLHENPGVAQSNERLEFLGDSVLGLAVSETLMSRGLRWNEGELSRLRSYFVSEPTLANAARRVGLGRCVRLGKGERQNRGGEREAMLADAVEALLGAVYLDQGIETAARLVREKVLPELSLDATAWELLVASILEKDAKSRLQEFFQQQGLGTPRYVCLNTVEAASTGPFVMALCFDDVVIDQESGLSKKEATQSLARRLLAMSPPDLVRSVANQLTRKGLMTSGS